jgi:hypothetical protein
MLLPWGDQLTPIEFTIIFAGVVICRNPRPLSLTTKRLARSFASLRAKTSRFPVEAGVGAPDLAIDRDVTTVRRPVRRFFRPSGEEQS